MKPPRRHALKSVIRRIVKATRESKCRLIVPLNDENKEPLGPHQHLLVNLELGQDGPRLIGASGIVVDSARVGVHELAKEGGALDKDWPRYTRKRVGLKVLAPAPPRHVSSRQNGVITFKNFNCFQL